MIIFPINQPSLFGTIIMLISHLLCFQIIPQRKYPNRVCNIQVLKRIEDVQMMCEKRKSSLKKLATRLPRPVHAVTPEPAVPLHYPQGHANVHPHSHPASPLHADLPKSPKSMRKASTLPKVSVYVVLGCVSLLLFIDLFVYCQCMSQMEKRAAVDHVPSLAH